MTAEVLTKAVEDLGAELPKFQGRIEKQVNTLADRIEKVEGRANRGTVAGTSPRHAWRDKLVNAPGFLNFKSGAPNSGRVDLGLNLKTLSSLQGATGSPTEGFNVQAMRNDELFGYGYRPLTLLEALPHQTISSNRLEFQQMNGFTAAAAAQAGEGTVKAEQSINPQVQVANVATYAVFQRVSRQLMDDVDGFLANLERLLSHTVSAKIEADIISGTGTSGAMSGLAQNSTAAVVAADGLVDRLGETQALMATAGYQPDLVLLSPVDWWTIRSERGTDGHFVAGSPNDPLRPSLWGMRAVASAAVPAGASYVLDSGYVRVLDRMGVSVVVGTEDSDNFTKNLVTCLAEARAGLVVYDTAAVYAVGVGSP